MNVILYTTNCPKCVILEKKLKDKHIAFKIIDDINVMTEKGFMSAPMLEVDNKIMNFMEANTWINNI